MIEFFTQSPSFFLRNQKQCLTRDLHHVLVSGAQQVTRRMNVAQPPNVDNQEVAQPQQEATGVNQPPPHQQIPPWYQNPQPQQQYMAMPEGYHAYQYPPIHQGYMPVPAPQRQQPDISAWMRPYQAYMGPLPQEPDRPQNQPMEGVQQPGPVAQPPVRTKLISPYWVRHRLK